MRMNNAQSTRWNYNTYTPYRNGNASRVSNQQYNQQYNYNRYNNSQYQNQYQAVYNQQAMQQARLAAQHGNSAVKQNQEFANYHNGKNLKRARKRKLRKNRNPAQLFQEAKVRALRDRLKPPAAWLPSSEIALYAKMNTPAAKIESNSWLTFVLTAMVILIAVLAGIVINKFIFIAVLVAPFLVLILDSSLVKSKYQVYKFYRQLLFSKFSTVLDLSELKRGLSINELLSVAAKRMNNKSLENAVDTLNSRIEDDPTSKEPYMTFADQFSDTPDARLFMASVFRMSRGFYDDSEIHSLKVNSGKDLMFQSKRLMIHKLARFQKIRTILFGGFTTFLIYFMLSFVVITVKQII